MVMANPFASNLAMLVWDQPGRAQYVGRPRVWAELTGDNQFTPGSYFAYEPATLGLSKINIAIFGTFAGELTLQRSFDDGVTWYDVGVYTAPTQISIENTGQSVKWRVGFKNVGTGHTSGAAQCLLTQ